MKTNDNATARFDARISKEQKDFFEYAASLGGFRTLTEFILFSVHERAKQIVKEHDSILASKRDKEIFFKALLSSSKPNPRLRKAAKRYKVLTKE